MFGFPLTLYLLSGWLGSRFPELTVTHRGGHIWNDLIGWKADPHISPFHIASYIAIIAGLVLIGRAWPVLRRAQRAGNLASTGPYSRMRHPQYSGFLLVMVGFLLQWPTIPTILMFPILAFLYRRLAIAEEREVRASFGAKWDEYARATPRFIPRLRAEEFTGR